MAFEELKEKTEDFQEQIQEYIDSSVSYYKLWGFKVAMKSTTMILKFTLILLFFGMVMLFCSIACAFAIGSALGSNTLGFLSVGGIYLVLTLLVSLIKEKVVEGTILEKFSEIFFND